MSEVGQDRPEINPSHSYKLLRDSLPMRMAYEIATNAEWTSQTTYQTTAEAHANGLKIAEELDRLAYDDNLLFRPVVMSGPSVVMPDAKMVTQTGGTIVDLKDKPDGPDKVIQSYDEHRGGFFGFSIIVKVVGEAGNTHFVPQLVYVMQTGEKVQTPVISGFLSAYGLVKDTEIHFVEDEVRLSRRFYVNEMATKSIDMDDFVADCVEQFMAGLDQSLSTDALAELVEPLELIANHYDDNRALGLIDTMIQALRQYLDTAPVSGRLLPRLIYSYDDSLDNTGGPALRQVTGDYTDEALPLNVQDIVFMSVYDQLDSDGHWAVSTDKIAYFVYSKDSQTIYVPARSAEVVIEVED